MNDSIVYMARPSVTAEAELSALVNVYKFVLAKKEATRPGSPDDGTKVKEDSANEHRST
jgi:hypothetical protein